MKKCSENMQQIYRKPPMPKCITSKVPLQLFETALWHGYFPVNLLLIFKITFCKNTFGGLLLNDQLKFLFLEYFAQFPLFLF